jgi:predicted transcriptional regulator
MPDPGQPNSSTVLDMGEPATTEDIAKTLRARIAAVREELQRYDALRDELGRLEAALADLEPVASPARDGKSPRGTTRAPRGSRRAQARSKATRRAASASSRSRTSARGETRERILEFIRAQGPATAGEVAAGLNLNRNSVATRLSQLVKAGELQKADRGYSAAVTDGASKR